MRKVLTERLLLLNLSKCVGFHLVKNCFDIYPSSHPFKFHATIAEHSLIFSRMGDVLVSQASLLEHKLNCTRHLGHIFYVTISNCHLSAHGICGGWVLDRWQLHILSQNGQFHFSSGSRSGFSYVGFSSLFMSSTFYFTSKLVTQKLL